MNKRFKIVTVAIGVAAVGGLGWYLYAHDQSNQAAETDISKVQEVSPTAPVEAIKGKAVTMNLTNQQATEAQVTIPGLQNTPQDVASGATTQLKLTPSTPGTYPIIETVTQPNTRSIEGGTTPAQYEVGHVVVN